MKTAAIYARCARRSASSITEQTSACARVAALHSLEVQDEQVFVDNGSSSSTLDGRAGLSALREALKTEALSAVVVQDLSRLSRNVSDLLALLGEFEDRGVQVIAVESASAGVESVDDASGPMVKPGVAHYSRYNTLAQLRGEQ